MMRWLLTSIQYAAVFFALAAAICWLISTRIDIPGNFSISVASTDSLEGKMSPGYEIGRKFAADSPDLAVLATALRRQNTLGEWAAGFAIFSAVLQVVLLLFPA